MKKIFLVVLVITLFILTACSINAPLKNKMLNYYSDNNVYSQLYGEITSVEYFEDAKEIVVEIDILTQGHSFPLNPETGLCEFSVVNISADILDISVGDEIEFTSAPMYFYNGHRLPIVSLSRGNKSIVEFEVGKEKYIRWINETF